MIGNYYQNHEQTPKMNEENVMKRRSKEARKSLEIETNAQTIHQNQLEQNLINKLNYNSVKYLPKIDILNELQHQTIYDNVILVPNAVDHDSIEANKLEECKHCHKNF